MMLGLHNLKAPKGAHKKRKILGRGPGSGHGKTSTRGHKGQGSRTGHDFYPGFEGGQMPLMRKIPKRGFTSQAPQIYQIVNIRDLTKLKDKIITPEILENNRMIKDKTKPVKILAQGSIKKAITIEASAFSKAAETKIKEAGGICSLR